MPNSYTVADCMVLYEILLCNTSDSLIFYDNVIHPLKVLMLERRVEEADVLKHMREWLQGMYRDIHKPHVREISKFILDVPLDMVPLEMNNELLLPYFRWRCTIGK